jgi:RNase H-fold protein (predicted Holliday junction resolvase)
MKRQTIIFLLTFLSLVCYSQQKVKSGYITFNSNSSLYFKNLVIAKDSVNFKNEADLEMSFSIKSVKKIVDNTGTIIYQPTPIKVGFNVLNNNVEDTLKIKKDIVLVEKIEYQSPSKIYLMNERLSSQKIESLLSKNNYALDLYKKGKSNAILGDILVGGGLGLFIGGGLSNLATANSGGSGSSTILIVGLVTAAAGIPVKIGASKNIRQSIDVYNGSLKKTTFIEKADVTIIANSKGVGFSLKF